MLIRLIVVVIISLCVCVKSPYCISLIYKIFIKKKRDAGRMSLKSITKIMSHGSF